MISAPTSAMCLLVWRSNVRVLEYAVSDNRSRSTIRIPENFSTANLVWHRADPTASEIVVETISIDELVESGHIETLTFVKIDVEGAEGQVLAGMRKMLVGAQPYSSWSAPMQGAKKLGIFYVNSAASVIRRLQEGESMSLGNTVILISPGCHHQAEIDRFNPVMDLFGVEGST